MDRSRFAKSISRLATNKLIQKQIIKGIDHHLYKTIIQEGPDDIEAIAERKYEWALSLLNRGAENINRKYISKHVLDRLAEVLIDGAFKANAEEYRRKHDAYIDAYGIEPPSFLVISPTQRCNLNCSGCYASSSGAASAKIPFSVFDRIVTEMEEEGGNKFVVISGGEPMMYEDDGKTLFDIFERHPDTFFMFYTNGTLIDDEKAQRLEELGNGVPAISVEGYEQETDERRGKGVYRKIVKAMEALRTVGMPFIISVTGTSANTDILLDRTFYETYFDKYGCSFMWQFQLMPIGRGREAFELMPSPEQRVKLYRTWESLLKEKRYPFADFWNSGVLTHGCIAYGRGGGYLYINWNGDIMPCVFVPYTVDNIYDIYKRGQHIGDVLKADMMRRGRKWQEDNQKCDGKHVTNLLMPCSIRDHYGNFRSNILTEDARGENSTADEILEDSTYYKLLTEYDDELKKLTEPIWQQEYLSTYRDKGNRKPDKDRHDSLNNKTDAEKTAEKKKETEDITV